MSSQSINYRGLNIPFVSFGNVSSDDLFSEKEQAIFDFYEKNKSRYRRVLDIGANIGVHSILMARQGWEVKAFEPIPWHFGEWQMNYIHSGHLAGSATCRQKAVSDHDGFETFVCVQGNTTGSHLKGDKKPYGELEEFEVGVVDCRPLFKWADFAKIDCEGHEAKLLLTMTNETKCDFMVEVGTPANAVSIYQHLKPLGLRMWAQNRNWQEVTSMGHMPVHHSEGALFIGESL